MKKYGHGIKVLKSFDFEEYYTNKSYIINALRRENPNRSSRISTSSELIKSRHFYWCYPFQWYVEVRDQGQKCCLDNMWNFSVDLKKVRFRLYCVFFPMPCFLPKTVTSSSTNLPLRLFSVNKTRMFMGQKLPRPVI